MMYFTLMMTELCNMNCDYCFEVNRNCSPQMMSSETVEKIFNSITEDMSPGIHIFGGEPTLNRIGLQKVVECVGELHYKPNIRIFTNAFVLDERLIDIFSALKAVSNLDLTVGLDLIGEFGIHERMDKKGKSTYDIVKGNIDKLISLGFNVHVNRLITKKNHHYLYEILHRLREGEFVLESPPHLVHECSDDFTHGELEYMFRVYKDYIVKYGRDKYVENVFGNIFTLYDGSVLSCSDFETECSCRDCGLNDNSELTFMPDGQVLPCRRYINKRDTVSKINVNDIATLSDIKIEVNHIEDNRCSICDFNRVCNSCKVTYDSDNIEAKCQRMQKIIELQLDATLSLLDNITEIVRYDTLNKIHNTTEFVRMANLFNTNTAEIIRDNTGYNLKLYPSNDCNKRCSFCSIDKNDTCSVDDTALLSFLNNNFNKLSNTISVLGGEPLLYLNGDRFNILKTFFKDISITTNFDIETLPEFTKDEALHIIVSNHTTLSNRVRERVLSHRNVSFINSIVNDDNIGHIEELLQWCVNNDIKIRFNGEFSYNESDNSTRFIPELERIFKKYSKTTLNRIVDNFRVKNVDYDDCFSKSISINNHGEVYKCCTLCGVYNIDDTTLQSEKLGDISNIDLSKVGYITTDAVEKRAHNTEGVYCDECGVCNHTCFAKNIYNGGTGVGLNECELGKLFNRYRLS